MEVIEETGANWLVKTDDGGTEMIGKSKTNRALIEYDLWGLLRDGTEVYQIKANESRPSVTLIPDDEAMSYTLRVGDYEGIHLGPHMKSELVDALVDSRDNDEGREGEAESLISLYDRIRERRVRTEVVSALAEKPPFSANVEGTADGWVIHGYLLLTWERDFHHPDTTTYERSGSTVTEGSSEPAYRIDVGQASSKDREVTLNKKDYRLTDAEMEFMAKALWAIANAPSEV